MSVSFGLRFDGFLLTPLREGRPDPPGGEPEWHIFLLTPLREGRRVPTVVADAEMVFLLTPLREGRRGSEGTKSELSAFLLTPLREGRPGNQPLSHWHFLYFYSRPCGRGDAVCGRGGVIWRNISTHAPAGGATPVLMGRSIRNILFLLTPLREGRRLENRVGSPEKLFLLTPLREGRLSQMRKW